PVTGAILAGARAPEAGPRAPAFADTMEVLRRNGGMPAPFQAPDPNTVIGVVATNARLDKEGANLLARTAGVGLARVIRPAHTLVDGDTIFALSAGDRSCNATLLGAAAAEVVARAAVRAILRAETLAGIPALQDLERPVDGIRIRPAGDADHDGIAGLMRGLPEWFRPESVGEALEDLGRWRGIVAELAGRILGFAVYGPSRLYPDPGLVKIHWIGVARSHRGRGIGRALVRVVEDHCRRAGGGVVELMTVAASEPYPPYDETRAFYRAAGYHEHYNDLPSTEEYGCEMVHLRKEIPGEEG
ncbi:MAG: GNAT family N-acetyltransferase, partial [Candidatus Eisenbacteria bacterium]|nr:GNAT family N-acetyltransferase [Candidatus Latescibacterota bacterium]MBD3302482.1 GNAT family N-acetyltransferase [Candidatus Eisenbacteria bacterium]